MASLGRKNAGIKKPTSGFADPTIGEDGMTGRERAVAAGRKGGGDERLLNEFLTVGHVQPLRLHIVGVVLSLHTGHFHL